MRDYLARLGPDLVHTHIGAADVIGGLAARSLGIPAVSTLHSAHWSGLSPSSWARLRIQVAARRRCHARIITVSESVREEYLSRGWNRPERTVTVHNGIIDRSAGVDGLAIRHELGLASDETVVTMVGALARNKGQAVVAAAARELAGRFPRMRVLIVGDGPLRAQLEAEIAGYGDHTTMIGHRDDVPSVLAATDILVHPTHVDALPTVLIEAMAAAVPIIATAIGGVPEMIRDGESGVLIGPPPGPEGLARALEPLLERPDLRRRLGDAGRRRFEERFTIEHWLERLLPVYAEAMSPNAEH